MQETTWEWYRSADDKVEITIRYEPRRKKVLCLVNDNSIALTPEEFEALYRTMGNIRPRIG